MFVGYRRWTIAQVQTGRTLSRPVLVEDPGDDWQRWPLGSSVERYAAAYGAYGGPRYEVETYPETVDMLAGRFGQPGEHVYVPGVNQAVCPLTSAHRPPLQHSPVDFGCGFYATDHLGRLLHEFAHIAALGGIGRDEPCRCEIIGLVGLSGTVERWTAGWKASHARVLALLATDAWRRQPHRRVVAAGLAPDMTGWFDRQQWETRVDGHAGDHLGPLAERYRIPVFADPADLEAYADRLQPDPLPPPDVDQATLQRRQRNEAVLDLGLGYQHQGYHWGGLVTAKVAEIAEAVKAAELAAEMLAELKKPGEERETPRSTGAGTV